MLFDCRVVPRSAAPVPQDARTRSPPGAYPMGRRDLMEQKRLDLYTFSEHQLILLNTCINAWRGSTFWALMYMQSRLFHAENVDSIYRELQAQPAQYDQIMERYYLAATTPLIWTRWTRGSAARLSASAASGWTSTGSPPPGCPRSTPTGTPVYGAACLSTIPPCSAMPPTRICWAITTPSARPTCCWTSSPARWAST